MVEVLTALKIVAGLMEVDRKLEACHLPRRPSQRLDEVNRFCNMLCEGNQDRLKAAEEVCSIYTPFARG